MNLKKSFRLYLIETKGLANRTVKNYLSDYRHFIDWVKNTQEKKVTPPRRQNGSGGCDEAKFCQKITPILLKKYSAYLSSSDLAKSTVKRRLSTLRIFCQFLLDQNLIKSDPSVGLENPSDTDPKEEKISRLTNDFQRYLKNQGASDNTIKNYLADARNYLEWAI